MTGKMYACKKIDKKRMKLKHAEKVVLAEKLVLEKVNRYKLLYFQLIFLLFSICSYQYACLLLNPNKCFFGKRFCWTWVMCLLFEIELLLPFHMLVLAQPHISAY